MIRVFACNNDIDKLYLPYIQEVFPGVEVSNSGNIYLIDKDILYSEGSIFYMNEYFPHLIDRIVILEDDIVYPKIEGVCTYNRVYEGISKEGLNYLNRVPNTIIIGNEPCTIIPILSPVLNYLISKGFKIKIDTGYSLEDYE